MLTRCAMARPNRRFAVAAARVPHGRALHARAENWSMREVRKLAICEPLRPQIVDSTASLRSSLQTLRIDAVES
eukprot:8320715-Lingulodinium_polyedra.AAC.1